MANHAEASPTRKTRHLLQKYFFWFFATDRENCFLNDDYKNFLYIDRAKQGFMYLGHNSTQCSYQHKYIKEFALTLIGFNEF